MRYFQYPLDYPLTAHRVYEQLRGLGDAILLDSAYPKAHARFSRYDIITAAPDRLLEITPNGCRQRLNNQWQALEAEPFEQLNHWLDELSPEQPLQWPFCSGLAGYFSYDLGRRFEQLPSHASADIDLPWSRVGRYRWAVVIDHHDKRSALIADESVNAETLAMLKARLTAHAHTDDEFHLTSDWQANMSRDAYIASLNQVDDHIHAGDCYQINFTQRFSAGFKGDPWHAYQRLRQVATTPFSAYLDTDDGAILSLSPERFLAVTPKGEVETRPIKGTRPRHDDPVADAKEAQALADSLKDQAENVMIVDLMRNDLSRVCSAESVKVPELFSIEQYPNVHHLVSSVTGQLAAGESSLSLLKACFPGGSITGAPKIRAMEIIDKLEPQRRSIYCGSIGYINADGRMDTNIAIRTLLAHKGRIHCWGGGGIVADSDPQAEYQESLDKIGNLLAGLQPTLKD